MMKRSKDFDKILFDDLKFALYGIPVVALLAPLLFLTISFQNYIAKIHHIFIESMIYTTIIWFCLRSTCVYLRKKFPSLDDTFKRNIYQAIGAFIITFIMVKIITFGELLFYKFCGLQDPFIPEFIVAFFSIAFISLAILVMYEAIYFFKKLTKTIQEKEQLKTAHVQTQLVNLRNQINPHFLFNSLNTLMNLIPKDENRAMSYLDKLSKFYRYSVSKKDEPTVPISVELENVKNYAELLRERFGENISISINNGVSGNKHILPMTLQLLIENAVKHNIVSRKLPLSIDIYTSVDQEYIHVKNNLQKKIQAVSTTGMGLENIRERFGYFTEKPISYSEINGNFEVILPLIKHEKSI